MIIVDRKTTVLSPWVTLVERHFQRHPDQPAEAFHSLRQADYVTVLGVLADGRVPLVRQFRPALEATTLELPGGLRESGESPVDTALRELYEETGCRPTRPLVELACLLPDTGRLENRLWCYFAGDIETEQNWCAEDGVEMVMSDVGELKRLIVEGEFNHALHVAIVGLAQLRGLV